MLSKMARVHFLMANVPLYSHLAVEQHGFELFGSTSMQIFFFIKMLHNLCLVESTDVKPEDTEGDHQVIYRFLTANGVGRSAP